MDTRRVILFLKKLLGLLLPVMAIVVVDQYSKQLVRESIPLGREGPALWPWLASFLTLVHTANTGVAFGSLQGMNDFFTVLVAGVAVMIMVYYLRTPHLGWLVRLGLILLLGGNLGNLIDRIRQGYVTDFLAIRWFAVINLADACITIGVILVALGFWLKERESKNQEAAENC